jgi:hypothetical protein
MVLPEPGFKTLMQRGMEGLHGRLFRHTLKVSVFKSGSRMPPIHLSKEQNIKGQRTSTLTFIKRSTLKPTLTSNGMANPSLKPRR